MKYCIKEKDIDLLHNLDLDHEEDYNLFITETYLSGFHKRILNKVKQYEIRDVKP